MKKLIFTLLVSATFFACGESNSEKEMDAEKPSKEMIEKSEKHIQELDEKVQEVEKATEEAEEAINDLDNI